MKSEPTLTGGPLPKVNQITYLGQLLSDDAKFSAHNKKRTKKAAVWRSKASSVARKRGEASFEAEKTIRDAGEKASGLYGAEAWCSMHGPCYDELSAKQARIEREMLGLGDKCELWRAREEMGTEAWNVEKFLAKMDVIQKARMNASSAS